ncbi:class III signal peptide-containing protein [Methanocaldococcus sp. 28A]
MKLIKKLLSKKGQISMEIGILVAAAVLVAIIAGYYYVKNVSSQASKAGEVANNTTTQLAQKASEITGQITNISVS